uniref:VWA domain-containing protein n=1 Tax=Paenirhodobacter enshiensis TaxID=1105367 RepID=UPI0035B293C1
MGSSKKQTVGYKYFLGAHLALCHGPADVLREILVDDKVAWSVTTGAVSDGGTAAVTAIGTATDMAAVAGESTATLTFPGTLSGIKVGQSYVLTLASAGTVTVTVTGVMYDPGEGATTWFVTPAATAFAAQAATVTQVAATTSNTGGRGGRIAIDAADLFGGESREGGIEGDVDVLMGEPAQGMNDYLAEQRGANVPAYRGIVSLVLRQLYMGINPYLKPWAVRLTRILAAEDGAEQWYPEKAQILGAASISDAAIYFAIDTSGSMAGSRFNAAKEAVASLIEEIAANVDSDEPNDIRIVTWADSVRGSIERDTCDADEYAELAAWMRAQASPVSGSGGTNYAAGLASCVQFFEDTECDRKVVIFVTDGEATSGSMSDAKGYLDDAGADVFCFNIALEDTTYTAQLDNTPIDDVPVVTSGDTQALINALRNAFGPGPDMNPAHIIRECLTNGTWGLGHSESEIGPSFEAAADTLFAEQLGLSFLWQDDGAIEDFLATVQSHIDASVYVDRRTGLWEIKLIRDDYDVADLPVFDEGNVTDWGTLGVRQPGDLVNSVTVKYTNASTESTASVSVTDAARVIELGDAVSQTVEYPGARNQSLAVRLATRDLRALSAPILSGQISVNRDGADLNIGDAIVLNSPRRSIDGVVMRVQEIGVGSGRDNAIKLTLAEDVFSLGTSAIVGGAQKGAGTLTAKPTALKYRMAEEAPYWLVVQQLGHDQAETMLASDPTAGVLTATGEQKTAQAVSAQLWVDPGTGTAEDETAMPLVPVAVLAADLSDDPTDCVLSVTGWQQIGDVQVGSLAWLGGELVVVYGITATEVTVGRGCLDTVPHAHAAGEAVLFFGPEAAISQAQYVAGEEVTVRLLPETPSKVLAWSKAGEDSASFDSRAFRPLPPGNVQGNGVYAPDAAVLLSGDLELSWAHRDRLSQTGSVIADYRAASIGPEAGTDYVVQVFWVDPETDTAIEPAAAEIEVGSGTGYTLSASALPLDDAPAGTQKLDIALRSRRDGLLCHDYRSMRFVSPAAVGWDKSWNLAWGE